MHMRSSPTLVGTEKNLQVSHVKIWPTWLKALENWIRVEIQKRESERWNDLPLRCHPHTFVEVCLERVIDTIFIRESVLGKMLEMDTATLLLPMCS